jgi:enoyl-CoA hydratase/carnithine racemase
MSASFARLAVNDGIGVITLANPPLNLMTLALRQKLDDALEQALSLHRANGRLHAIIVTGAGERAFCCGSDISEFPPLMAPGLVVPQPSQSWRNFPCPRSPRLTGWPLAEGWSWHAAAT